MPGIEPVPDRKVKITRDQSQNLSIYEIAIPRRELALFNLAIDSKLRACDLVRLRVRDVCHGGGMASRAIVLQQKSNVRCSSKLLIRRGRLSEPGSDMQD